MAVELFESNWQKHDTLHGLIYNNFLIFKKNIFLYFVLHASFFYTLGVSIYLNNFNGWMISIIIIKFLDMAFKINMMQKLNQGMSLQEVMPINMKMSNFFRYFNVIAYPFTFAIANSMIFN